MKVNVLTVGDYQVNCYVLKKNNEILIIDPGAETNKILSLIQDGDKVSAILLTHGHFDHIGAVDDLVRKFDCPVLIHPKDNELAQNPKINSLGGHSAKVSSKLVPITIGEWTIGDFNGINHYTPGHTAGSVIIQIEDILFTGDTLFYHSIGRTDLFSGSEEEMKKTIQKIKLLPRSLLVYSGHGEMSILGDEIKNNPYF